MRGYKNNLVGQTFGLLTVFAEAISKRGSTYWRCRCECGRECIKEGHSLLRCRNPADTHNYHVPNCGCRKKSARAIAQALGNPGRIVGAPERIHHRGRGSRQ